MLFSISRREEIDNCLTDPRSMPHSLFNSTVTHALCQNKTVSELSQSDIEEMINRAIMILVDSHPVSPPSGIRYNTGSKKTLV